MAIHPERDPIEDEAARILADDTELRKDLEDFGRAYDSGQVSPDDLVSHDEVRRRMVKRGVDLPPPVH